MFGIILFIMNQGNLHSQKDPKEIGKMTGMECVALLSRKLDIKKRNLKETRSYGGGWKV